MYSITSELLRFLPGQSQCTASINSTFFHFSLASCMTPQPLAATIPHETPFCSIASGVVFSVSSETCDTKRNREVMFLESVVVTATEVVYSVAE